MKKALLLLASAGTMMACAVPAAAASGLSFRELEYEQPRDPLLPSNQSADITEHTAPDRLAPAVAAIGAAVPAGTPRAAAEAVLRQAGAHCAPGTGATERCSYFDVETRDEYVDAVHWNVDLSLANDTVSDVRVNRDWVRD
jgi:hypothetical protein